MVAELITAAGFDPVAIGGIDQSIRIEVFASRDRGRQEVKVTEALFTFVALDEQHRPRPVKRG